MQLEVVQEWFTYFIYIYIYIYKEVTVEVLPSLIRFRVWKNIDCFTDFSSINRRVTNATIHLTKINNTKKEYQV